MKPGNKVVYLYKKERVVLQKLGFKIVAVFEEEDKDALNNPIWIKKGSIISHSSNDTSNEAVFVRALEDLSDRLEASMKRENTLEFD